MKISFLSIRLCALCVLSLSLVGCGGQKSNNTPPLAQNLAPPTGKPAVEVPKPAPAVANPLANWKPIPDHFVQAKGETPMVALTFDAGSDAKAVDLILKTLAEKKVRCTFFLTGKFCEKFPQESRAIADAGMEIGNHSYSHPHFTKLSESEIRDQLEKTEGIIEKTCGRGAKPLFRYPFGDNDKRTREIVAQAGYQSIYWSLDSRDSVGEPKTTDFIATRIIEKLRPGGISLMHVSCLTSAEALPRIFDHLDKLGVKVVPVSELMQAQAEKNSLTE